MSFVSGFGYAIMVILQANLIILYILAPLTLIEMVFNQPILIKKLFVPKPKELIDAGPRVLSFLYFLACFLYLINDAYIEKNAPDNFYYIQWLMLIYPLTMGVKKLADAVQWKG